MSAQWLTRNETVQLTRGSDRIVLRVNTAVAWVNGVQVWLSYPVAGRGGAVYVSRLDAEGTLTPLVSPPRARSGELRVICIDPGHGGKDPGYRIGSQNEKAYTLLLAQEVRRQLQERGFQVVMTRTADTFVDLPARTAYARARKAQLFVSLHFNSTAINRSMIRGSEVYCLTPAGATSTNTRGSRSDLGSVSANQFDKQAIVLAHKVQQNLLRQVGMEDRGVRRARFAVLREAAMPAVLIEGGFLSHPAEGKSITDSRHRSRLAKAIVDSIVSYGERGQTTSRK